MSVIEKLLKKENKLLAELKELNGEKAKKGENKKTHKEAGGNSQKTGSGYP